MSPQPGGGLFDSSVVFGFSADRVISLVPIVYPEG